MVSTLFTYYANYFVLPFVIRLLLNHFRYLAIGIYGVYSRRQVRYIDTCRIGGFGYFRTIYIIYAYVACRYGEVESIADGVRADSAEASAMSVVLVQA